MSVIVNLPDGRKLRVDGTDDPAQAKTRAKRWIAQNPTPDTVEKGWQQSTRGAMGHFLNGVLPGAAQAVRGVREAGRDIFDGDGVNLGQSYQRGHREQAAQERRFGLDHPTASTAAEIGGFVSTLPLVGIKALRAATMGAKMAQGAKTGAILGAASGAASSDADGVGQLVNDTATGGLVGAGVGGAIAPAARIGRALASPLAPVGRRIAPVAGRGLQAVSRVLPGRAGQVARREAAQLQVPATTNRALDVVQTDIDRAMNNRTGQSLGGRDGLLEEAQRRADMGAPAAAADISEGLRRTAAAAIRTPGPAQDAARRAIYQRQQRATSRVVGHIEDTLGSTTNVERQAQGLRAQAMNDAAPLYEQSNAQDIPLTPELRELFSRPSGRAAIHQAGEQLLDEGIDPLTYGMIQGSDGLWTLGNKPSMQAYDYAKSVLDRTVFAGNKPFAPVETERAGRGAANIRGRLLDIMDGPQPVPGSTMPSAHLGQGLNPHWRPAREAYGTPIQAKQALETGSEMANSQAVDATNRMQGMSPEQIEMFRLGHRTAMGDQIRQKGDFSNAGRGVAGNLENRELIAQVHGDDPAAALQARLDAEHEGHQTYKAVYGNSMTADKMADDVALDADIASMGEGIYAAMTGNPWMGLKAAAGATMAGRTDDLATKGNIGSILTTDDIGVLRQNLQNLERRERRRTVTTGRANRAQNRTGRFLAGQTVANLVQPVPDEGDEYIDQ